MANRRLAPAAEQPASFAFSPENADWAKGQIEKYPEGRQASAVIPLLWKAQEQNGGWLPQKAIEAVADELGMPHIRVLEVATFYTMFALEPVGRFWIQLCGTVPCDSCGARELKDYLHHRLGAPGHVSADGNFSWLEVECLGACCNAPMAQINQDYYEDLTPDLLGKLMDDLAAGRPVKIGSQVGRTSSEPLGGADTLADTSLFDGSRVGAWRKRFEEKEAEGDSEQGKAEAASSEQRAAAEPKPARPDAGRAVETPATDAPAQRTAVGESPIKASDKVDAADGTKSTTAPASPTAPAPVTIAKSEAAGAEAGTQSSLPRNEPPPQPVASGISADVDDAQPVDTKDSASKTLTAKPSTSRSSIPRKGN
ncbi:NADH-quinone oxidoreductase subunit E [Methylobacterium sp. Leaf125]|uniref:NADH-quinone oxidoreductase subunit NuoE n=1 Tax=Methylobacterium sp. Leaf125 TaxID=1736265 RepID=UPI0006F9B62A|nr:NADH-quinone oxidoreductase subunit NuoE [Methylobacterium sp. Leaf125]KQQ48412.1 NADH-quinone oxidoreductase subunit E [Methylobacterium sp. Leaf125]